MSYGGLVQIVLTSGQYPNLFLGRPYVIILNEQSFTACTILTYVDSDAFNLAHQLLFTVFSQLFKSEKADEL